MNSTQPVICENPNQSHAEHLAHHFDTAQQQFDAGKLGMWLFLVTEVLFFSGLFVAYAVYRSSHPEVFVDAHKYLNTTLGAFNTIVLLLSSLTMAWAVRSAQLGHTRSLVILLAATLACSSLFLGVKAVEYSHKWGEGLLWAGSYSADTAHDTDAGRQVIRALIVLSVPAALGLVASATGLTVSHITKNEAARKLWISLAVVAITYFVGLAIGQTVEHFTAKEGHGSQQHSSVIDQVARTDNAPSMASPSSMTGVFFSIYYAMTGVHAIHILAGMGVMVWLLRRSLRGEFGPSYFGPVDYVGLYWHLVDLVWIYLFPLLYLIR